MSGSQSIAPPFDDTLAPSTHFHHISKNDRATPLRELGMDEAYSERANLEALVRAIGQYLVTDILIVDDNSPYGTGELADQLSCQHGHVHVLHRPNKEGLGPAYLAGFTWALQRNYSLIIEMVVISVMRHGICPAWCTAAALPTW